MSNSFDHEAEKSPEELEQEINAKRASISNLVDSLESRMSPGQLFDQALSFTKGNGGEFYSNLCTTLKNNPVPTALTAVGVAWLALNQNRPFNPGPAHQGPGLGDKLGSAVDSVKGAFATAGDKLHSATDAAKEKAHDLKDKAYDLKDKASDFKGKASDYGHDTSQSIGASADSLRRSAHDARDQVNYQASALKGQFDHLLKEQPLVIAAIGIALGAAIGAALPSTRKEDELMGDTSDRLTGAVKAKGQDVLEQAKAKGQEALEEVKAKGQEVLEDAKDTMKQGASDNDKPSGGNTPGSSTPGGNTPSGSTSGSNTPGSSTSSGNMPGSSTSGGNTPGSSTSSGNMPGSSTSGGNTPGSSTSGGSTPGSSTSGGNTPGSSTSGGNTPGGSASGGTTPGGSASGKSDLSSGLGFPS
ncbi:DUF3618 domain-containing protein [Pseudomonas capeferrum]|uniref:DUF3618 domain-containing protein n=1 Tax=Pseudomonas capeferrum TaxID=1495066 RepID=UPI0015E32571|nr:DUF3618 domain-containing protein [Pseudomonas capeferrum]MBA1200337.1 DUF3618 domain-containing protein [Pseudomonas capeferrum]